MKQYFSFQWHITDECDQRCKHCYIFSEDNGKKLDAMTWAQMQDVVDNCCDMCEMYDRLPLLLPHRRRSHSAPEFLAAAGPAEREEYSLYHHGQSIPLDRWGL